MQLAPLIVLGMTSVTSICSVVIGRNILAEWNSYRDTREARDAITVTQAVTTASTQVSLERGPTNGGIGAALPIPEACQRALAEARARTDRAMAAASAAAPILPARWADPLLRSLDEAASSLARARRSADALAARPLAGRSASEVTTVVDGMIEVVPAFDPALNTIDVVVARSAADLIPWLTIVRATTELRDQAGQVGSVFTPALAGRQPLTTAEIRRFENLSGRTRIRDSACRRAPSRCSATVCCETGRWRRRPPWPGGAPKPSAAG